jgi:chorismate mutase
MDPKQQKTYIRLIQNKDRDAIMELLTNRTVEAALLRRLRRKALIYGSDITETGEVVTKEDEVVEGSPSRKIQADVVVDLYERFVIPLTKEVEVEYLLQRLDGWQIPEDTN